MDKAGKRLLFEFRAGKCTRDGKKIVPDNRKGQVQIFQTLLDGLFHFGWFERDAVVLEDDLVIFPNDAKWRKLPQGRIFLLEFASAPEKKHFYWVQEPSPDRDVEIETTVQKLFAQPIGLAPALSAAPGAVNVTATTSTPVPSLPTIAPVAAPTPKITPANSTPTPAPASASATPAAVRPTPAAGAITPEALNAALGLVPPASAGTPNVQSQLQAILSNFLQSTPVAAMAGDPEALEPRMEGPSLGAFLAGDQLVQILSRHPDAEHRLLEFCPPELQQPGEIRQLLRSPQFQQAVDAFNYALATGQIQWSLFSELNIDRNALGARPSAERFLRAIRAPEKKDSESKPEKMDTK